MIDSLESRLEAAIASPPLIEGMLRGIARFERYKSSIPFVPFAYTRTLLLKQPEFELVVMQWSPGSVSAIHDHGDSRCWVVVMEGALDVEKFDRLDDGGEHAQLSHGSSLRVNRGDLDHRLNWRELHRVRNTLDTSAYSLQLYSPLLTEYRIVNDHTGMCSKVPALYDSVLTL